MIPIMEDWVGGRDSSTYVKERNMERLGWETHCEDSSYSSFFDSSTKLPEVLLRAYKTGRDFLSLLEIDKKVSLQIINGEAGGTDGNTICVATDMFDAPELSVGEKQDIFVGLVLHEGCHLLYTDMGMFQSIKNDLKRQIYNILEDERIEGLLAESKPGFANFFEKTKKYYFGQYAEVPKEENDLTNILNLFLHFVRYPSVIKEDDAKPYEEILTKIREIITPYPETPEEVLGCTEKIFELLKKEFKKDSSEMGEGIKEMLENLSKNSLLKDKGDGEGKEGKDDGEEVAECTLTAAERRELSGLIEKAIEEMKGLPKGGNLYEDEKGVKYKIQEDNRKVYMDSYDRIRQFIPAVSKILKIRGEETKLIMKSMRSGHLDTGKIAEAVQGVSTVYIREGKLKVDKVAVCVLIDESGSMSWGRRVQMARDSAVLINEAIGKLPNVELFIYGHTADHSEAGNTDLYVYREPGVKKRFSLGSASAKSNNRDGDAIINIAKRVRRFTKEPVLFFVLSDGSPSAHNYYGASAVKHTKEAVQKIEKMGFTALSICMEEAYEAKNIYKRFVVVDNLSELPMKMGKIVKKAILTHTKKGLAE